MVDFIFIGPSKTASTWIYEAIRPHPELFVPVTKDIYFFDKYYGRGEAWYEGFFRDAPAGSLCGELSHDYFFNPVAIDRIHAFDPAIKLICCLRNPFERAYSSYLHMVRVGMFAGSFEDALEEFPFIVDEGKYHTNLRHIFSLFGREAVLILDFDELEADPARFARRIFNFLGVDETFVPAVLHQKVNPARDARSVTLARMAKRAALLLRHLGCSNLLGRLKHSRLVDRLIYRPAAHASGKPKTPVMYPEHLVNLYRAELDGLSQMMQADYSKWCIHAAGRSE
ncbi:MAG TPA: sulfotransferase domain-containing protein [Gallionella sp.]|nr:sulfotransferase domain-containing protein [Gallionella sp.]